MTTTAVRKTVVWPSTAAKRTVVWPSKKFAAKAAACQRFYLAIFWPTFG